jgi:hypothetical protein
MQWVGFEPTIPAFKREKTVHALDSATAVFGETQCLSLLNESNQSTKCGKVKKVKLSL